MELREREGDRGREKSGDLNYWSIKVNSRQDDATPISHCRYQQNYDYPQTVLPCQIPSFPSSKSTSPLQSVTSCSGLTHYMSIERLTTSSTGESSRKEWLMHLIRPHAMLLTASLQCIPTVERMAAAGFYYCSLVTLTLLNQSKKFFYTSMMDKR